MIFLMAGLTETSTRLESITGFILRRRYAFAIFEKVLPALEKLLRALRQLFQKPG
jgi:hypothetical protein